MDDEYAELDFVIRSLSPDDLGALVRIDQQITGRSRRLEACSTASRTRSRVAGRNRSGWLK